MRLKSAIFAASLAACGQSGAAGDQAALAAVVDADADVSVLLHQADGLVVSGKARDALAIVDGTARERAEKNAATAENLAPRSPWGKERLEDVKGLARDRRASVSAYRSALASDDVAEVVRSLEAQKAVETRAMTVAGKVRQAPPSGCGD